MRRDKARKFRRPFRKEFDDDVEFIRAFDGSATGRWERAINLEMRAVFERYEAMKNIVEAESAREDSRGAEARGRWERTYRKTRKRSAGTRGRWVSHRPGEETLGIIMAVCEYYKEPGPMS